PRGALAVRLRKRSGDGGVLQHLVRFAWGNTYAPSGFAHVQIAQKLVDQPLLKQTDALDGSSGERLWRAGAHDDAPYTPK
ncbi:MAG: hypothetical protein KGJ13_12310, partial [Patescibacteria group bacterium]|nr:hypothetical protein [Patescibacteria group bacterium]